MKEYFLLLDGVFTTNKNVQAPIQKKLKDFYPVLKVTTNKKWKFYFVVKDCVQNDIDEDDIRDIGQNFRILNYFPYFTDKKKFYLYILCNFCCQKMFEVWPA